MTTSGGFLSVSAGRLRIEMHALVPLLAALLYWRSPELAARYALLLACLLVHEMAHAGACLLLRGDRARVRLWPVFGRADVAVKAGWRRGMTALAAPLANLLLAGALFLAGGRFTLALGRAPALDLLFTVNLLMGLVNLLPVGPLDGGLALREWRRFGRSGGGTLS